jgi:hypothetical protein
MTPEEKIADLKANFDLAIEGRDIKIKELEKKNKELESDFRICEKNADTYYDQLTKAKKALKSISKLALELYVSDYSSKKLSERIQDKAEQFLKEIEK